MKFIISSYKTNKDSIGLFEVNKNKYTKLSSSDILAPSFIVSDDNFVYTYEKSEVVSLYSFKIENNNLIEFDKMNILGTGITHITYSKKNKLLIGCSYSDGTFFCVGIENGKFTNLYSYVKQIEDERLSRCHCVLLNKNETTVAVVNIALDAVYLYDLVANAFVYKDIIKLPNGSGPRHAIYNKDNSLMYVMTEYSNEVIVIDMHTLDVIQRIPTVYNYIDPTFGATLVFSNDSKYLYASNRGEDSIAKYEVLKNGRLKYINSFSCGGNHPRHMIVSKDGKYIISCNKNSNNIAIIDLSTETIVLSIPFENVSGVDLIY